MPELSMITKMKKELSNLRISLLEAATDHIATITELHQEEAEKNHRHKPPLCSSNDDTLSTHQKKTTTSTLRCRIL